MGLFDRKLADDLAVAKFRLSESEKENDRMRRELENAEAQSELLEETVSRLETENSRITSECMRLNKELDAIQHLAQIRTGRMATDPNWKIQEANRIDLRTKKD